MRGIVALLWTSALALALSGPAHAGLIFSSGDPDGKMAMASRPDSAAGIEIEAADDFILHGTGTINSATFTGLLVGATPSDISQAVVEIYRVFPNDSDVGRTSGPPTFSTDKVPTRVNSPSDVAFDSRDSAAGTLTLSTTILNSSFTADNSVLNGINPKPNQTTGGDGSVTGEEVLFSVTFNTPFTLPPDHYFFVPQVLLDNGGQFYWLSAPRPITGGTGPFNPDLQAWIRNGNLDPDWLRVGTDIVGAGTFNASFSLSGTVTPEPSSITLLSLGLAGLCGYNWRRRKA